MNSTSKSVILPITFSFVDVLFHLFFAGVYFTYWIYPDLGQIERIYTLSILIGFEFIMVMAGTATLAAIKYDIRAVVPVLLFYGIFALIFNTYTTDNVVLWIYAFLTLNRIKIIFIKPAAKQFDMMISKSALYCMIYFLTIFPLAFMNEWIPKLGLTKEYLLSVNYFTDVKTIGPGGLLTDSPQFALCFGGFYFFFLALIEFLYFCNGKTDKAR